MNKFSENVKCEVAIVPIESTDATGVNSSSGVSMANYGIYVAKVSVGPGMAGDVECSVTESTDDTTYAAISGGAKTGTISSDTESGDVQIEVRVAEMTSGYKYLRINAVATATETELISAIHMRVNSRYPQATLP